MAFPLAAIPLLTKAGAGLAKLGTAMKGVGAAKSLGMNAAYLGKGKAAKMAGNLGSKLKQMDVGGSVKDVMNRGLNMSDDAGILDRIRRGTTGMTFKNAVKLTTLESIGGRIGSLCPIK